MGGRSAFVLGRQHMISKHTHTHVRATRKDDVPSMCVDGGNERSVAAVKRIDVRLSNSRQGTNQKSACAEW